MTSARDSMDQARAQAEELLQSISGAEAVIVSTIERECAALRSGCMLAARALHTRLCDAVKLYLDAIRSARASLAALEQVLPGSQDYLEERREAFSALLKLELAVLASEYEAHGKGCTAMSFTGESLIGAATARAATPQRRPSTPPLSSQGARARAEAPIARSRPQALLHKARR